MSTRLRVALLSVEWPSPQHDSGGVAHYAYRLASELAELVDLTVVTSAGGEALPGATMVHLPRSDSRVGRYYLTPLRARGLVNSLDVDVVHAFGDDWALAGTDRPVIRTFHGSSLLEARSSSGLRRYNHYMLALLERWSARKAVVRLGAGADSHREFACDFLVPPVVRTSVAGEPRRTPTPSIVFVGTFGGRKRGWLAERLADEASLSTGLPVELVAITPTSERTRWSSATTVVSGADDDEVMRRIGDAWLLLAPSTYEGFGIPAFEALSAGVRVVATANPGSDYIASVVGDPAVLTTCRTDDELLPAVVRAIESGPTLTETEASAAATAVEQLVERGSPTFLVETVYPLALPG